MRLLFGSLKELLPEVQHRTLCFRAVLKRYQACTGKSRFAFEVFTPRSLWSTLQSQQQTCLLRQYAATKKIQILTGCNEILTDCTQS